jgi:peptidoglycan hydrolase-like protein with peptidoglycan-binding domain
VRRNTILAIGLAAVVVAALLGWIAGRGIRSPAEIAARTAPPDASPIVVPVEQKVLASTVVTRGTVRYGSPLNVVLPRSPAKQGNVIMTIAPVRGATLGEGNLAMTVSGRPVFVLQGPQPVYRDMGTGAGGQDVRQLEEALDRMGHGPGPVDGVYDGATGAAVRAWYAAAGWTPFDAGDGPGSIVPADEVVFFPSLPVRVDDVFLQAGQEVGGPVMVVTSSQLTVTTGLSLEDAKLVRVGATVQLEEPDLGITAPGVVATIADTPGTLGIDPSRYYLEVTPIFPPPALAGKSVVMTIAVDATEDEVLAVPIAALSVGADNTTRVEVQQKRGTSRIVVVEPGLAAQGLVEVTPVRGELSAGDPVVVGYGDSGRRTIPAPTSTTPRDPDGQ